MIEDMSQLKSTLKRVEFFNYLNFSQLDELINALKKVNAKKGEVIIKQVDIGDKFYIIASGEVSIHKKKGFGGAKKVAVLGDGDFFGEIAMITDLPRTATVVAEKPSVLYVLNKNAFRRLLLANPKINQMIQDAIFSRKG